jgi:hypothetical protein
MGIVVLLQSVGGGDLIRLLVDGYEEKEEEEESYFCLFPTSPCTT